MSVVFTFRVSAAHWASAQRVTLIQAAIGGPPLSYSLTLRIGAGRITPVLFRHLR